MSDVILQVAPRRLPLSPRTRATVGALVLICLAVMLGGIIGHQPLLALLAVALAGIVIATPFVETLAVLTFWLLPYLILNLPTGGLTLKVPEVTAYLFATTALARALLRREKILLPPATPQVLLLLAAFALSAAVSAPIPPVFGDYITGFQGPGLRSIALLFWLALSWLVVISLYHIIGTSADLYRRCVRAHILTGAFASLIGIVGYVLALRGGMLAFETIGHGHSFVYNGGSIYRLTGVSYEPLIMAFYLDTVIPVTLVVALYRHEWLPRRLALGCLFLQAGALLLTFSAGGVAALTAGLLLLMILLRPPVLTRKQVLSYCCAALLVAGLIGGAYSANTMIQRAMAEAVGKIANGGYKERNDEFVTGVRILKDHLWFGVGPGMTPFYFPMYHPSSYSMMSADGNLIANLYVTTLAETGLVGFAALAACGIVGLTALARTIRRHGPLQVPILTALTVSLIGCAIQYWEMINLFLIYFSCLIGLAAAGMRLAKTQAERP